MATIYIDGRPYEADPADNLLHACLSLGFDLPYFCWHPALGSVGACRQCAVKQYRDEQDTRGRIVMACMTPAADGTRIAIDEPEAKAFRAGVIEWLMTNHPHDCPVCEEGGECHLQDMTVMTGHVYRRYRFRKRTFRNQYLGPFINHEMNRCIACYRCVRFYGDYAGGHDLQALGMHNHVYFGRQADGVLENEFSGNLVEVCPTGVFTDKTLGKRYARKWDLRGAPSVCVHCGLGCNTHPNERGNAVRRILNRYNGEVNGYFLCDRGRFGYGFVNGDRRLRQSRLRRPGETEALAVTRGMAVQHAAQLIAGRRVIGIGSPRASLEANFALYRLVGAEHFYSGLAAREQRLLARMLDILRQGPARTPSLRDAEQADAVLVLGEDLLNTAPRLALSLRQAVRHAAWDIADHLRIDRWNDAVVRNASKDAKSPLYIACFAATRLDDIATGTYHGSPDELARFGLAVAHALDPAAPAVPDLPDAVQQRARQVAQALQSARRPLIIAGPSSGSEALIQAAANVAWALCRDGRDAALCFTAPECNSFGLALMGGRPLDAALQALRTGEADTLIVLENDLYRRMDRDSVDAGLGAARHVIAIDCLRHGTTEDAELVLPAGTFAEADGTLVSSEGRMQRFFQVFTPVPPAGDVQESWRWLRDLGAAAGDARAAAWQNLDDVIAACAEALPQFAPITQVAPSARFRIAGMKLEREPHRYSGRTAVLADLTVHEPKPPQDPDSPLSFTMEGYYGPEPAPLIPFFWAPGWNSIQSVNKFQDEVGESLRGGDPGRRLIEPAADAVPAYFADVPPAFRRRPGEWLLVPLYHLFGSEELSALAPAVAERAPAPYLALNAADAAALGIGDGGLATVRLASGPQRLPVRIRPELPAGLAGLPLGLPGLVGITLPAWARIEGGQAP
ncbi:MAG: NADH-quinone oxidoreductase subunit NuoG [Pseudomonadota bacterium]